MARKPALRWMRFGLAAASWMIMASVAQGALGADMGRVERTLEQRFEMQLKGKGVAKPPAPQPPERSHEDAIQPWELVGV